MPSFFCYFLCLVIPTAINAIPSRIPTARISRYVLALICAAELQSVKSAARMVSCLLCYTISV